MERHGNISKAIEICQSALKQDPGNAHLHVRLGDLYLEKHLDIYQPKQYIDEAINEYQFALESNINSAKIHYKLGVAFYHKGNIEKSLHHLDLSLQYDPKYYNTHLMNARILIKKNRFLEAVESLNKAIDYGNIKSSRAHYLLFLIVNNKNPSNLITKLSALYNLFLSIVKLPFDQEAQTEAIRKFVYIKFMPIYLKGYYYEKTMNVHESINLYSRAVEDVPGFVPLYLWLGNAYRLAGRLSDAINEYRMAIWLEPINITAHKLLCSIYEEQGDYNNAVEIYKKLIEMNPNDAIYQSNLANIYYLKGDIKSAISHYQTAIALNPSRNWTSIIAQTLGYIFHESKDNYDAAICAYQSASILNPNDIDVYLSLGSAFYDKGDYSNALNTYRLALEIAPDNPRIHCNLGFLLWGKGMIDDAVREYEKAISLESNYDIAFNNLGVIYLDNLGYIEKAIECLKRAIECNGRYALAHYNLGRAMTIKGDNIEAARLLQIALDLNAHTRELDDNEIRMKIKELFD
jgi:tetratricopeptide (TPR) repeat protein